MTGVGDTPRSLGEFVVDTRKRTTSLERNITAARAQSLASYLGPGAGMVMDGTGTLEEPFTLGLGVGIVTDWDDANDPGWYFSESGALNAPFTGPFIGQAFPGAAVLPDWVTQEVIAPVFGDLGKGRWRRHFDGTNWTSWRQVNALSGYATVAGTGTFQASANVSFPTGYFLSAPAVVIGSMTTGTTTGVLVGHAITPTTSGFTLRAQTTQGTNFASNYSMPWIATEP